MLRVSRWYGRKGVAVSVLGGIDVALWDIAGKTAGLPVWKLLGASAPTVPAYASALLWSDPERLADEARSLCRRGFNRIKMRLGQDEDYDTRAVEAVRKAVGSDIGLMVDCSMRYTLADARAMEPVFREASVFWWEEPFEPDNIASYAALQAETSIALACGENEFGLHGFQHLLDHRAVRIVQPDVSRSGGITEAQRIAAAAADHSARVATHTWSDAIAVIANAHLVASLENGLTVEVDQTGSPFVDDLLEQPLEVANGMLTLSEEPGLGIVIRADIVDQYRLDRADIPSGNYSDMLFGDFPATPKHPWTRARSVAHLAEQ
jgi:L-alanine-DL-glutamate epimerase-like enolase superfamily enzyme